MGLLSSGRGIRPKRFDYEPRFYNPKKEEKIKQRMRVQSPQRRVAVCGVAGQDRHTQPGPDHGMNGLHAVASVFGAAFG